MLGSPLRCQPRDAVSDDWPHWPQNFAPACIVVPHLTHAAGSIDVPHCWQKRAPGALAVRQAGHAMAPPPPLLLFGGGAPFP